MEKKKSCSILLSDITTERRDSVLKFKSNFANIATTCIVLSIMFLLRLTIFIKRKNSLRHMSDSNLVIKPSR